MTVLHNHDNDLDDVLAKVTPTTHSARNASHFRNIVEARETVDAAEERLREAVRAARRAGDSWTAIAAALGTSKQAAHQRFAQYM